MRRIDEILDSGWLTNDGPFVKEFESRLCQLLGVEHCIAVCNGTAALEIAIRALELSGEVITPAYTFVATAHALQWLKIKPVFVDVDPKTHTLAPELIEARITEKTMAILGVHLWGTPCDVEALPKSPPDTNCPYLRRGPCAQLLVQREEDRQLR